MEPREVSHLKQTDNVKYKIQIGESVEIIFLRKISLPILLVMTSKQRNLA